MGAAATASARPPTLTNMSLQRRRSRRRRAQQPVDGVHPRGRKQGRPRAAAVAEVSCEQHHRGRNRARPRALPGLPPPRAQAIMPQKRPWKKAAAAAVTEAVVVVLVGVVVAMAEMVAKVVVVMVAMLVVMASTAAVVVVKAAVAGIAGTCPLEQRVSIALERRF